MNCQVNNCADAKRWNGAFYMKLYWNTISFQVAVYLCCYGNLPYNFLKLLPYEYESLKDSMQKLIRAELVGVIKAKNLKN